MSLCVSTHDSPQIVPSQAASDVASNVASRSTTPASDAAASWSFELASGSPWPVALSLGSELQAVDRVAIARMATSPPRTILRAVDASASADEIAATRSGCFERVLKGTNERLAGSEEAIGISIASLRER